MRDYNLILGILIAWELHGISFVHSDTDCSCIGDNRNKLKTMPVSSLWRERNKRGLSGVIGLIRFKDPIWTRVKTDGSRGKKYQATE